MALTKISGSILKDPLNLGEVSIGGTLTYQDVTNVDSVGIITARSTIDAQGSINLADSIIHTGDTDTKIVFGTNEMDFQAAGSSRFKVTQYANYVQSGLPLAFLASSGATPNIKSGGTNNQDLLLTAGTGNPTRIHISSGGNIGIGTDNPRDNLHILGTSPGILITDSNAAANIKNWSITAGVSELLRIQAQNDSYSGGGNLFDFYRSGNQINEFRGVHSGNTWFVIDNLNKRVGINTTASSGAALKVLGNTEVRDIRGNQNLLVSESAFKFSQSVSNWSTMNYTASPVLAWDYKSGPGDLFYIGSGGNTAIADQMAVVVSDAHGIKIGKSGYDGSDFDISSSNEFFRVDTSGRLIVGGGSHAGGSALVVKGGFQNTYSTIGMFSNHTNPSNDTLLSQIRFGSNGTAVGADIRVYADADWGSNDYPSRIEFYTTPDGSNSKQLRLQINKNGDIKIGNSAPGPSLSSSPTMIRYFGKKVMQGTVTSTTTLNGSGSGTFELGKIWNADDTSIELFITCSRSDSSAYTTSYCKGFCQKVRGTGITDGHIIRQDTAAAGFQFNNITSGGYSGTPSHGARVNVSGGVANQSYTLTCFYTAISKNDQYS